MFRTPLSATPSDSPLPYTTLCRSAIVLDSRARLRFAVSYSSLAIACGDRAEMDATFRTLHRRRFGYSDAETAIVVEALSVEASGHSGGLGAVVPQPVAAPGKAYGDWTTIQRSAMQPGRPGRRERKSWGEGRSVYGRGGFGG